MSELACHTKFHTLGGIDNFHSRFHWACLLAPWSVRHSLSSSFGVLLDKQFAPKTFGPYFHSISVYHNPLNSPGESAELHLSTVVETKH